MFVPLYEQTISTPGSALNTQDKNNAPKGCWDLWAKILSFENLSRLAVVGFPPLVSLESPQSGRAAVHGVTKSWTGLSDELN